MLTIRSINQTINDNRAEQNLIPATGIDPEAIQLAAQARDILEKMFSAMTPEEVAMITKMMNNQNGYNF